jgi:ATP-dependent helicase/nuclease subunit A
MKGSKLQKITGDNIERTRAVEETNVSFVVEASAGTGKTRTLLDRILHLVLERGPGGTPVPLSRICAITFTEKAAGEMKLRLRQELEKKLLDAATPAAHYGLAREALNDLETASISTFHSFAVSLLKERPVEAGLDPHFTALDDIRSELFFREIWEPWINRALSNRYPVLEKALRNGFRLQNLLNLAIALRKDWLNIRDLECDRPPSEEQYREEIKDRLQEGRRLLQMNTTANDRLAGCLEEALVWLEHPEGDGSGFQKPGNAGAAKNWSGGKETVQAAQQFLRALFEFQQQYKELPKQRLLHEVVSWIKNDFMIGEWEQRKRDSGLLDFDDQLRLARDLLLQDKTVRKEFQQQYRALLVDEFQDTDLIQWSIVLLLSSTDLDEKDPAKLKPESGRLFVVGDPKQSIYRFRNADIETYLGIVDPPRLNSFDLERLEFTTNFRSVPSILCFVDAAFENAMRPAGETHLYQPGYLAFGGRGFRDAGSSAPAVYLLGDVNQEGDAKRRARETVETESTRIARLILEMNASENWKVHGSGEENGTGWRAAQFGDVAVLLPVLTHAHVLEEKLRDHGIPYVLEGGKFYYARSEVSSAILVLHAIANPNDSVALYGSLRSIFFGLSDEDLLRARIDGLSLDYRKEVPHESPLYHPFEILRDLHRKRHERRASETFEVLLQNTGAREVLAVRGFQSLANLNKLSRTLRAFQNDATFSQVVDLLDTMDEEELAESESRLMEERSNAVRIMSIHKAKGLDFPIVIAAALGLGTVSRTKDILVDRAGGRVFSIKAGSKDSGLRSSRWQEFADEEKKRENAELVRLLYVALTRAQDHLVLSTHTAAARKPQGSEKYVPDLDKTRLQPLDSFLAGCYSEGTDLAQIIDGAALDAKVPDSAKTPGPKAKDWESIALKEYGELHALVENTPYSANLTAAGKAADLHETGEHSRDELMPEAAANRSLRLGVAFHEAMERVDLFDSGGLNELAQEVATRHRLDPVSLRLLVAMMNETLSSELLSQAREALRNNRRVFREMTFVRFLESSTVEEGKIDMLFESRDGWILVDYKTDWVSENKEDVEAFFRRKYTAQIREYANALRARSIDVAASYLLVARTGMPVRVDQNREF